MKLRNTILAMLLLCISQFSAAQKKWDGEAKDAQWNNPLNWYPNGVPGISDDIILDHTYIQDTFSVVLMDTITATINSLQIISNASTSIRLLIPVNNVCSPALHLNTTGNALMIGQNAVLQNRSGATAGNSITLNGSMIIKDHGRYIHSTLRGNSVLMARLSSTDMYRKGIFEFDVPGTSGYILSLSGRQLPNLQLSSTLAGKKTYSGSGNSNCAIKGNLMISDSSTLNLSINGNLLISGDLRVNGKFLWQPTTTDITGRELQFNGDSCRIQNTGAIKMGANFRKLVVQSGRLNLKTPIRLDFPTQGIEVRSRSTLNLDSFYCSGPGWFQSDSLSSLHIGSGEGISDTTIGNIRMGSINIHQGTLLHFTSEKDQSTGMRFPSMLTALILNKPSGDLLLNRDLTITDSIAMNRGNILSNRNAMLEFKGERIMGKRESFIKGPLKRTGRFVGEISFPVGDDSIYAPTSIHSIYNPVVSRSYTISYQAKPAPNADSLKNYPVKSISSNEYWIIENSVLSGPSDTNVILRLPISIKSLQGINGQPSIVHFDSTQLKWVMMPLNIHSTLPNTISTTLKEWKNGLYTFGELYPLALPVDKLKLQWKNSDIGIHLHWKVDVAGTVTAFLLETNTHMSFTDRSHRTALPGNVRSYRLIKEENHDLFLRIKAIIENRDTISSNIIRIPASGSEKSIFPNPTSTKLYIETEQSEVWIILHDGRKFKSKVMNDAGNSFIDVYSLPSGIHRVQPDQNKMNKWIPFIKL